MYSRQLRGPFSVGQQVTVELNTVYRIMKLGVERPHSTPIPRYYLNGDSFEIYLTIDGERYTLTEADILEVDGLYQYSITIGFPRGADEYTIIDLTFMDIDNGN